MKTILRNFFAVIRRFKMATLLNILGLTIALAAFVLIMIQVSYDQRFNRNIEGYENLFRLEMEGDGGYGQAVLARPLVDHFVASSPHVVAGSITNGFIFQDNLTVDYYGTEVYYRERIQKVTPTFPDVVHFDMVEGIANSLEDVNNILISESLAKKMFAEAPFVGKQLKMWGVMRTVSGVYKDFPENTSLGNPVYISMGRENEGNWSNFNYVAYIKLDSPGAAKVVEDNFATNYKEELAAASGNNSWVADAHLRLTPFSELHYITGVDYDNVEKASYQTVIVLIGIAFVLLIIAAINYTNFSMALTPMRVKSINTQKVMGAADSFLRKVLLSETVVICTLSFLLSLLVVFVFSRTGLAELVSGRIVLADHWDLVGYTFLISLVIALCAGVYPARYITSFSPALVLKGSFGLSPKGRILRNGLLCFQFIASFALIIGASFMYLQNHFMQNSPLGYEKDEIIIAHLTDKTKESREALTNELQNYSGVAGVAYSQFLLSSGDQYMGWGRDFRDGSINFQCLPVLPGFIELMGIELSEGRSFRVEDERTTTGAVIFNERARSDYQLNLGDKIDNTEIVGFMKDVKFASFRREVSPMAFWLWGTENWGDQADVAYIKIKAGTNYREAMQHVNQTLDTFDPGYPFIVRFFDEVLQGLYVKERKMTQLISLFSFIAIFISIVGVLGLVIFESQYKLKEIGLRKVMGSTTGEILVLFNKVYIKILVVCFVIAVPISYLMVKNWLENFAYRTPLYWWVYVLAFLIISLITLLTVTFQNLRAAHANPVNSIKNE